MSTATLHNEKKKTLVPQLRFQEFDGEWENNKLSDWKLKVIDGDRGTNYPNGDDFSPEGYCLFMNAKNVTKNGFSFETKMFITKEKDEKLRKGKLKRNDLILTTRGSVGNIAFYDDSVKFENLRINSGMVLIRNENSKIDSRFIYSSFFTPKLNRIIDTISFGSAQPQLTVKEINLFKFNIPTLPEQQKIASFLSAVDEKIQQLTRKATLLEQYKKGVMQQLFSGKLRFKDENGKDYPDWEEKRLGNLTFKVGKKNKENIQYPIYSINNKEGFLPQSEQFDGLDSNDRGYDISLYKIVESETFAYNPARINVGSIGYSYNLKKVIVSSLYVCFKTVDILEDLYLLAYLDTYNFKKDILRFEEGGVRQYLFYENFSLIKIPLPSNKEQQKIANFLSSIDCKIESVNLQLAQTQTFKKGLLQQLFV
jgi:type I restriction enzyme S subunit